MNIIKYGIRKIGDKLPVTYYTSSNEGGYACVGETYSLATTHYDSDQIWATDSYEQAVHVLNNSTAWYNAGYNSPTHNLEIELYEIVKVETIISIVGSK